MVTLAAAAMLAGCSSGGPAVADQAPAATPAVSPRPVKAPAGTVLPIDADVTAAAVDESTATLALAVSGPDRLLLVDLAAPEAPPRTVNLPGRVEQLDAGGRAGELLVPVASAGRLLTVDVATGRARTVEVDGGPVAAAVVGGRTVVALAQRPGVAVLDGDRVRHTADQFAGPADVVAVGGTVTVLDRMRTALVAVDAAQARLGASLRAGHGATNAVGDRFGRVLVTDTRDGELLVFSASPLLMRQRFPVPGAPYAIAYDPLRDLAWVTLTERNEVVGFDVAGGEPIERYRLATVRQPDAVAVDPRSGAVLVGSGTGDGVQVVKEYE
ncbi:MAG TPA: hypothetical protein VFM37_10500 [Pseudonocardiaceae bacterium]|nr:hypothetical protein [Pseudonocardiaceae bacterium]